MSNADSGCYTKLDWLWKNVEPIMFDATRIFSAFDVIITKTYYVAFLPNFMQTTNRLEIIGKFVKIIDMMGKDHKGTPPTLPTITVERGGGIVINDYRIHYRILSLFFLFLNPELYMSAVVDLNQATTYKY